MLSSHVLLFKYNLLGEQGCLASTTCSPYLWKKKHVGDLDESISGNGSFGDDFKILVKDKGKIPMRLKDGRRDFILNVYYVPNMKNNITSLGTNFGLQDERTRRQSS